MNLYQEKTDWWLDVWNLDFLNHGKSIVTRLVWNLEYEEELKKLLSANEFDKALEFLEQLKLKESKLIHKRLDDDFLMNDKKMDYNRAIKSWIIYWCEEKKQEIIVLKINHMFQNNQFENLITYCYKLLNENLINAYAQLDKNNEKFYYKKLGSFNLTLDSLKDSYSIYLKEMIDKAKLAIFDEHIKNWDFLKAIEYWNSLLSSEVKRVFNAQLRAEKLEWFVPDVKKWIRMTTISTPISKEVNKRIIETNWKYLDSLIASKDFEEAIQYIQTLIASLTTNYMKDYEFELKAKLWHDDYEKQSNHFRNTSKIGILLESKFRQIFELRIQESIRDKNLEVWRDLLTQFKKEYLNLFGTLKSVLFKILELTNELDEIEYDNLFQTSKSDAYRFAWTVLNNLISQIYYYAKDERKYVDSLVSKWNKRFMKLFS